MNTALNPARCFGLMAASERWKFHYVHWLGDISAALINAGFHRLVPAGKILPVEATVQGAVVLDVAAASSHS